MTPDEVRSRRSRILAKEQWDRTWPDEYHDPGRPNRDQAPFFELAIQALGDHIFGRRHKKPDIPKVIMFEGPTGCGKTHLAAVLTLFAALRASSMVYYLSLQTLASDLSGNMGERRKEPGEIMDDVLAADIVVLDDIGTQNGLGKSVTPEIIEACASNRKLIVGTTNNDDEQIVRTTGERSLSRLKAGVWIKVPLSVPDFREGRST